MKSLIEGNQSVWVFSPKGNEDVAWMDGVDGLEIAFDPTDLTLANHKRGQERQKTGDRF